MKRVTVIGIGLGLNTITPEASEAIAGAEVLLGAPRMLAIFKDTPNPAYPDYLPENVAARIAATDAERFAVLVSGDVGFYSAAAGLADALAAYDLRFIPGISTAGAFFAKVKKPWQEAAFISAHGRDTTLVDTVRRNRLTFCLTGNNVDEIGAALCKTGFGHIKTYIGENLGAEQEKVYEVVAEELTRGEFPSLTVLLFVNDNFDDRTPRGLPDSCFHRSPPRGDCLSALPTPMTKSETRAVVLSKLNLRPGDICWDVGAGTGSVTVEMALSAYRGHVYAVERREDAVPLIEQNCAAFHIGNVTTVCGEAPVVLEALPAPDAVFIGGSGGELGGIISAALQKNPNARIVITAVTIETATLALTALSEAGSAAPTGNLRAAGTVGCSITPPNLEPEIVQLNVARGKQAGKLHMMEAQNPVTILSAGGAP